ncbi:MAG: acyl carrier protein [Solirubrobacterales bacterium]
MSANANGRTPATDASTAVLEIVRELAPSGVTEVGSDTALVAELGFDSLGLIELLVALEDELSLPAIDIQAIGKLERVADLDRIVREAQGGAPLTRQPQ